MGLVIDGEDGEGAVGNGWLPHPSSVCMETRKQRWTHQGVGSYGGLMSAEESGLGAEVVEPGVSGWTHLLVRDMWDPTPWPGLLWGLSPGR